ncbi:MAG TPA: metallophosphoesterase [Candidatus Dormibacteraeota bacterium]
MPAGDLPVLIVGDVHGDIERLFTALQPYPPADWRTIFLGDLVDYGMFGVGALRYARDRPNSDVLLGNHEVAMLWALRDPTRVGWWMSIGGQLHDLDELRRDEALQQWVRSRPALVRLGDGTLAQHCGSDVYLDLARDGARDRIEVINSIVTDQLKAGFERPLWDLLSSPNVFETQPVRLEGYLRRMDSRRVVFGHKPHRGSKPAVYHDGKAVNFDGGLSRSHRLHQRDAPVTASVAPLD